MYRVEGYEHSIGEMLLEDSYECDDWEEFEEMVESFRRLYDSVETFKNGTPFRVE